ncbi:MAG TPA: hypothetical protein VHE79_12535, partial [Spirochaetia bacterium]
RIPQPEAEYTAALRSVMESLVGRAPQVFRGLAYFFDPAEILRPCFYRVYRVEDSYYLYLLRIDLIARPTDTEIVERGTNDLTPQYRTNRLFLEPTVIPLDGVTRAADRVAGFHIRQTISQTWIGEFGRGYFQQGIWMDADLTRFFSKLFLPAGKRVYPYFPYLCKYKTVCQSLIRLAPDDRAAAVPQLHRSLRFLTPAMERIQAEIKNQSFSEQLPSFRELKSNVPDSWYESWKGITVEAYLNAAEMKEYRIEG